MWPARPEPRVTYNLALSTTSSWHPPFIAYALPHKAKRKTDTIHFRTVISHSLMYHWKSQMMKIERVFPIKAAPRVPVPSTQLSAFRL